MAEKTAVLLVNLGTPDAPDPASVRRYLGEFLSDPRVIDLPRWKWLPILHGIILRVRPKKSAALYQSIWTDNGSPLLVYSLKQKESLGKRLANDDVRVELAMNYGNPSLPSVLEELHQWGMKKLIVLPLFPQYSSTTTASAWDGVVRAVSKWRNLPELELIRDYPDHPRLIEALTGRVQTAISDYGQPDTLILSYHGIPVRYAETGDDYPERCRKTTDALRDKFPDLDIIESFQSKFGNEQWLEPSTSDILEELPARGKKNVFVAAPSFTSDCLETLEELKNENAAVFHQAGGISFHYLPAVNDSPQFMDCLEDLVRRYLGTEKSAKKDEGVLQK
ncbi:ferrochelatase [Sporolactobacillus shoreae]|uniref:Coproporphyrin III ferrochelatase n=1 Tax=Sporolactobacillus shoreae TaxID=1465501 RepID=A0A4Z0GQ65_9BACL|nr:ferrochelatase [Sporolactobacillus shoreae]TGA98879.1 ferrochelatase [Sporolactobacillus shoreae]